MLIIQTDAAYHQASETSSIAYVIKDFSTKKILFEGGKKIIAKDNHEAEFKALVEALNTVITLEKFDQTLEILTDSKGLLLSVEKNYSKAYPELCADISAKLARFNMYYTKLISDKENKHAHLLALRYLHEK